MHQVFINKNGDIIKRTHFGLYPYKGKGTYIDHQDNNIKSAYISRHNTGRENWNDITTAGALSYYLLWNKKTLTDAIKDIEKKFKVKIIKRGVRINKN